MDGRTWRAAHHLNRVAPLNLKQQGINKRHVASSSCVYVSMYASRHAHVTSRVILTCVIKSVVCH